MLDTYRTRQLPQAAFLLASGAVFVRCEQTTSTSMLTSFSTIPTEALNA